MAVSELAPTTTLHLAPLRRRWGWIAALGVVYFVAGWIALGSVVLATVVSVWLVGLMMIAAGVGEVIGAFRISGWGKAMLWAAIGLLYILSGAVTIMNPLLAAVVLTFVLGITLVASGVVRLIVAIGLRGEKSSGWVALSAAVTILLGLMILFRWPVSSLYVLGVFMAIDLIVAGVGWISLAFELRREAKGASASV